MSACPRCGAVFSCCMEEDGDDRRACWCMQAPPLCRQALQEIEASHGTRHCLCPACLRALAAATASAQS